MSRSLTSRLCAIAITVFSTVAMLAVSFEAEAQRRMGGGGNFGRQSSNVTQMRTPAAPAANTARTAQGQPNTPAAAAAGTGAAAAGARSGASRWFGPIAGIAAGLGIAALLSSMGLAGAAAEFIASLLLIGLVVFAVLFLVRRLMGGARRQAMQGANNANVHQRAAHRPEPVQQPQVHVQDAAPASLSRRTGMQSTAHPAVAATAAGPNDGTWRIPAGFDANQFLQNAKQHFIALQGAWDRNDIAEMREYMSDDMIEALREPLAQREPGGKTDVILLNAEMLGIEQIPEGNLASVRFSGMLKDDSGPEAYRFEEVWNFLKPANGGWVLAGIQQIPVEFEN